MIDYDDRQLRSLLSLNLEGLDLEFDQDRPRHLSLDVDIPDGGSLRVLPSDSDSASSFNYGDRDSARSSSNLVRNGMNATKKDLLRQLLVAKEVLEMKSAGKLNDGVAAALGMSHTLEMEQQEDQFKRLRTHTLLKQRRNSAAIKLKSLEKNRQNYRSLDRLEMVNLKEKLSTLDIEIEENQKDLHEEKEKRTRMKNTHLTAIRDWGGVQLHDTDCGLPFEISSKNGYRGSLPSLDNIPFANDSMDKKDNRILAFLSGRRSNRKENRKFRHLVDPQFSKQQSTNWKGSHSRLSKLNGTAVERSLSTDSDKSFRSSTSESNQSSEISQVSLERIEDFQRFVQSYYEKHPHQRPFMCNKHLNNRNSVVDSLKL